MARMNTSIFYPLSLQAHLHIRRVAAQHLQCPLSTWTRRLSLAANRRAPFPPNLGYQSALLRLVTGERMGRPTESSSLSESLSLSHHDSAPQDMFSTICLYFLSGSLWLNACKAVNKAASLHSTLSHQFTIYHFIIFTFFSAAEPCNLKSFCLCLFFIFSLSFCFSDLSLTALPLLDLHLELSPSSSL